MCLWGKRRKQRGKGIAWAAPQRESKLWVLHLEAFIFLAGGNRRGDLRGGFQQNIYQFSRFALTGLWSPLIDHCQGWVSLVIAVLPWHCPPGFAAFLSLEMKYN